ncbi:MAG: PIN domain-containing protein [Methylacidiphilales bacterium]|nr:PIN domain-containing protein [Candidatus Methylacidiphilales bacterium]
MPNPTGPPHLHFDTNAILRYLRNDVPEQANAVETRLLQAQAGGLIIDVHPLVLAEVLFVLKSNYALSRERIVSALLTFLNTPGIHVPEEARIRNALARYRDHNVGFIDAFLATLGAETSHPIFSFDRGLDKFKDIRRVEK